MTNCLWHLCGKLVILWTKISGHFFVKERVEISTRNNIRNLKRCRDGTPKSTKKVGTYDIK